MAQSIRYALVFKWHISFFAHYLKAVKRHGEKAIQNEVAKDERDEALLGMIQSRIDVIYDQIVGTETYKNLEKAQNEVNELMEMVNSTITFNITGEQPSSCTHDCSTCGGCH